MQRGRKSAIEGHREYCGLGSWVQGAIKGDSSNIDDPINKGLKKSHLMFPDTFPTPRSRINSTPAPKPAMPTVLRVPLSRISGKNSG
jgi:hypothetical protein